MSNYNLDFGKASEDAAAVFLKNKGYKILRTNYRVKFGEIDIIAEEASVICFIEVKSRVDCSLGHPKEALTPRKQDKISRAALAYLKENRFLDRNARFDVLSIIKGDDDQIDFELIKDAFELSGRYSY